LGQLVAEVLETWRKSDRRAADLPSGTHEQVGARWAADELRAPYHGLTVEGMANGPGAGRAAAHQDRGEPCGQRLTAPAGSWTPAPEIAAAHASLCSSGALSFSPDGPAQRERLRTPLKLDEASPFTTLIAQSPAELIVIYNDQAALRMAAVDKDTISRVLSARAASD
jgi:hypothetical protein